jgi:hypothetical protein
MLAVILNVISSMMTVSGLRFGLGLNHDLGRLLGDARHRLNNLQKHGSTTTLKVGQLVFQVMSGMTTLFEFELFEEVGQHTLPHPKKIRHHENYGERVANADVIWLFFPVFRLDDATELLALITVLRTYANKAKKPSLMVILTAADSAAIDGNCAEAVNAISDHVRRLIAKIKADTAGHNFGSITMYVTTA